MTGKAHHNSHALFFVPAPLLESGHTSTNCRCGTLHFREWLIFARCNGCIVPSLERPVILRGQSRPRRSARRISISTQISTATSASASPPSTYQKNIRISPARSYRNVGLRGKSLRLRELGDGACVQYLGRRSPAPERSTDRFRAFRFRWNNPSKNNLKGRTEMSGASVDVEFISPISRGLRGRTRPNFTLRTSRASIRAPAAAGCQDRTSHLPMLLASYSPR
jgi:hypothetical protein